MGAGSLSPTVADVLGRFARALRDRFGERASEIVLFGSYARGEATEESDVDVLVVVADLTRAEELEVIDIATALKLETTKADAWVGLSPLVVSTTQAAELRGRGRRIWRDIEVDGVRL